MSTTTMLTTSPSLSFLGEPIRSISSTMTADAASSTHAASLHRSFASDPSLLLTNSFGIGGGMGGTPTAFVEPFKVERPLPRHHELLAAPKDASASSLTSFIPSQYSLRHRLQLPVPDWDTSTSAKSNKAPLPSSSSMPWNNNNKTLNRPVSVVGHRGALFDELENTRGAFLRCAELECDAVELDVFLLSDGELIVFHGGGTDENPGDLSDYCLNEEGRSILDLTFTECTELQFNPAHAEFPCPADKIRAGVIPTLEQVLLDLKPYSTIVKIELKGPGVVEPVLELVERLGMVDQCQYSSFDHDRLALLRQLRPEVDEQTGKYMYQTGALFDSDPPDDFIQRALTIGASQVHLRYDACTVDRIQAIHSAGMGSMAWFRGPVGMKSDVATKYWDIGNEDLLCYLTVMETGVQELCCNRPDILVAMLQQMQQDGADDGGDDDDATGL